MKSAFFTAVGILTIAIIAVWPINAFKLASCDFKSDYKCEVLHGIGVLVPPASYVTVWFGTDE